MFTFSLCVRKRSGLCESMKAGTGVGGGKSNEMKSVFSPGGGVTDADWTD